jgi:hypothetical protein
MTRLVYSAAAVLVVLALSVGTVVAQAKFVPPIKGEAEIQVIMGKPDVDHKANIVTIKIRAKNISPTGSIAGLKCENFWWDKANSPTPVSVGTARLKKPLLPGEEATLEIQVPYDAKMFRDTYVFSHGNGKIKAKPVKAF